MIEFKYKRDQKLLATVHPILLMIFADMWTYAYETHKVRLVVTQTVTTESEDKVMGRTSPAHREKRAIDIRTRDIDSKIVEDIINYINNKWSYKQYHYSSKSGVKRLAYWHIGTAEHLHLAINARYKL